jgi:hypothetical protein
MAALAEFSVQLVVTSNANALVPALQWYCQQDTRCSYAPASLSNSQCAKSYFQDTTHYSENLRSLGSACNEIHLLDGSDLFGGVSCTSASSDACPSVLYRYTDGRNDNAVCPTGTEMVVSAMGAVGDLQYQFKPAPGVEIVRELPEGCSLVGDAYLCDAGIVTLRFTASGDLACDVSASDSCPEPSFGIPYGRCGEVCQFGPEPVVPPATETFSATLAVTTNANLLTPSLEWSCHQDIACSVSAPPGLATACSPGKFADFTEYAEHIRELDPTACNEIVLEHGAALFGNATCDGLHEESSCGAVLYRYQDGRNKQASCPSGTQMQLSVTGVAGAIEYIVTTTAGVELAEDLPDECDFIADGYRCKAGTVNFRLTLTAKPCFPAKQGGCPVPTLGYLYGECGAQECSNGPQFITPSPTEEFQVILRVTTNANAVAPALEWYCHQDQACSMAPDSLVDTCVTSFFATNTEYAEGIRDLPVGCNQIVLDDGAALYGGSNCTTSAGSCGAVLYRYTDGRNVAAVCPSGSEMVVAASGTVGDISYIFNPGEGIELAGAMPSECVFVAGGYRCESGWVQLRFMHTANPACDITNSGKSCSLPESGYLYGVCSRLTPQECFKQISVTNITVPPNASPPPIPKPTTSPIFVPIMTPTSSPSASPSTSPGAQPSAQSSASPTNAPSLDPSTTSPSAQPSTGPSAQPSVQPSALPSASRTDAPSLDPTDASAAPSKPTCVFIFIYFVLYTAIQYHSS